MSRTSAATRRLPGTVKRLPAAVRRLPDAWRRPQAVVGALLALAWLVIAAAAPLLAPHDPLAQELPRLAEPGPGHWFGTDQLGRDILSRVLYGARVSITLTLLLVALSVLIGGFLGAVAGYFGRWADETIMRLADLVFAFPTIILAMVVAAALGASLTNAVLAVLVVAWASYARVGRGLVLSVREQEYVLSGRLLGFSVWRSLRVDVLPNVVGPILVLATLDIGTALLLLSGLSFLGLGATPPSAEWGAMVASGVEVFDSWWVATFPGLAILTVVLAFNFLGDTLRDALDPRTARSVKERAL
ncbi:ABC transporter permease [Streptomyces sp. NBC_01304]|uniref:ABC transporter permease n=1 Tax=Streptomyces sp. NBC_01304 TaxID=2903818 RepID=UPI002E1662E7|nr:ABC transporter permease [Streptomyces sp. NBC_01304]